MKQTAVAIRVPELFSVRRRGRSIAVRVIGYQGKEGIWVVALVYAVRCDPLPPLEGVAYLNPRRLEDYRPLQHLAAQEQLPFFFLLSPRLTMTAQHDAVWSLTQRQEARALLARIDQSLIYKKRIPADDPDFESAKAEFHRRYSIKTLLAASPQGAGRGTAFRGVVLD